MIANRLIRLILLVLMCGHFSAWAGINEDLLTAAKTGKSQEVERLLGLHADASVQDGRGATPLHWASGAGNMKTVELLIAHHANVSASDYSGFTPLHLAVYWKRKEIAQLLMEHGAEINARSSGGYTPLFKAIEPMYAVSSTGNGGLLPVLSPAAAMVNKELVAQLLAKGASVNIKSKSGSSPLHFASVLGVPDIVELLISHGAELDAKGEGGTTPLFLAARYDRNEVAEILLAHGAKSEVLSIEGTTPLVIAALNGNSATVEVLLRHGANPNFRDNQGMSSLRYVLNIQSKFYSLNSPSLASQFSPADKAELEKGRKAVKGEWQAVAKLLAAYGADVNVERGEERASPLYIAATMGDRELIELLLAKGAHVNGECVCETPLHSAIAENHRNVTELLVTQGANVNALNKSNRTPLHFLARDMKDGKLAELMIGKGADVNSKDKNGETPYDFAVRAGNQEVATVLQHHGAKSAH